ncbi:MAG: hypothetical protein GY904_27910 [Planctomycetaceae bacterium]|nr:hypothetical protein [Planctomycetaceae bacterium]
MSKDHTTALDAISGPLGEISVPLGEVDSRIPLGSASQDNQRADNQATNISGLDQTAEHVSHLLNGIDAESPEESAIQFRVVRPGTPNRRLRLTGNRYTFGNAEGCSIRLSDLTLRPTHAVLIRDTTRIFIRAYSVPILINGNRKTEATLVPGDVLQLGDYRFEYLTSKSIPTPARFAPAFSAAPRSVLEKPNQCVADNALPPQKGSKVSDLQWRERLRQEIDQWRNRQTECDRRENQCNEREADLRSRESELWTRAENLSQRESRLQSQEVAAFQLYDEYTQRQQELLQLREETQNRQESFNRREAEFRNVEFEYRHRLEDAARQLQQSQQQAETSTQSVQRMRAEFDSLNRQIEELSKQQIDMGQRENLQQDEQILLRQELEQARDQAIDERNQSDHRCQAAEARVEEMAAQLDSLLARDDADQQRQNNQLRQSQAVVEQLREQVEQLQQNVDEASRQSEQYRSDYEQACLSVKQLESLVARSTERGEQDRTGWAEETDQLRDTVEQLSIDLAQANGELSELRQANASLTARLDEMQTERDQTFQELETRPSTSQFESIQLELESAGEQLSQLREKYELTRAELEQSKTEQEALKASSSEDRLEASLAGTEAPGDSLIWPNEGNESPSQLGAPKPMETTTDWETPIDRSRQPSLTDQVKTQEAGFIDSAAIDTESTAAFTNHNQADAPQALSESIAERDSDQAPLVTPETAGDITEPGTGKWIEAETVSETKLGQGSPSDTETSQEQPLATDSNQVEDAQLWPDSEGMEPVSLDVTWDVEEEFAAEASTNTVPPATVPADESHDQTTSWADAARTAESISESNLDIESSADLESANDRDHSDNAETSCWDTDNTDWGSMSDIDGDSVNRDEAMSSEKEDSLGDGLLASMLIADLENENQLDAEGANASAWPQTDESEAKIYEPSSHPESFSDQFEENAQHSNDQSRFEDQQTNPWVATPDNLVADDNLIVEDEQPVADENVAEKIDESNLIEKTEAHTKPWSEISSESNEPPESNRDDSVDAIADNELSSAQNDEEIIAEQVASHDASSESVTASFGEVSQEENAKSSADSVPADTNDNANEAEDDDSIEAYMNRLLQRAQSPDNQSSSTTETLTMSHSLQSDSLSDSEPFTGAEQDQEGSETEEVDPASPLIPRSQAPEKAEDLRALRALANQTTRSASTQSNRLSTRDNQMKGVINFVCTAGAIVCGIVCFFFLPGTIRFVAVAMTLIVAAVYGREGFQLLTDSNSQSQDTSK